MKNFKSNELNRTFDSVMFLGSIISEEDLNRSKKQEIPISSSSGNPGSIEEISPAEGGITIAELYAHRADYDGKTVKIRGRVMKYSPNIMGTNWVHLQDGTDYNGENDLVVTSNDSMKKGDIVTLEGSITIDKDLGSGYFYKVIMEDSKVLK